MDRLSPSLFPISTSMQCFHLYRPKHNNWYHGGITGKEAETCVLQKGNPEGTFLIRDSEKGAGERVHIWQWHPNYSCADVIIPFLAVSGRYALAVSVADPYTEEMTVKHYRIHKNDIGEFFISKHLSFPSLDELVQAYTGQCVPYMCSIVLHYSN
jgi:hypothetical protein